MTKLAKKFKPCVKIVLKIINIKIMNILFWAENVSLAIGPWVIQYNHTSVRKKKITLIIEIRSKFRFRSIN